MDVQTLKRLLTEVAEDSKDWKPQFSERSDLSYIQEHRQTYGVDYYDPDDYTAHPYDQGGFLLFCEVMIIAFINAGRSMTSILTKLVEREEFVVSDYDFKQQKALHYISLEELAKFFGDNNLTPRDSSLTTSGESLDI